jgi:hypothetical protein
MVLMPQPASMTPASSTQTARETSPGRARVNASMMSSPALLDPPFVY